MHLGATELFHSVTLTGSSYIYSHGQNFGNFSETLRPRNSSLCHRGLWIVSSSPAASCRCCSAADAHLHRLAHAAPRPHDHRRRSRLRSPPATSAGPAYPVASPPSNSGHRDPNSGHLSGESDPTSGSVPRTLDLEFQRVKIT